MKTCITNFLVAPTVIAMVGLIVGNPARAQCLFGPQVQLNSASITNYAGTCTFEFTNAANPTEDDAFVPLMGAAAGFISDSSDWNASLAAGISARLMTLLPGNSSHVTMGLALVSGFPSNDIPTNAVFIFAGQWNNTGGGDNRILPQGWYGAAIRFGAITSNASASVMPLGSSLLSSNHSAYLALPGASTNPTPAEVWCSNVTGVVTFTYSASAKTVTGSYNGNPVGSYSLADWGFNPPLTLLVWGSSGKVEVPAGTATASSFYAGPPPLLRIIPFGTNVVLAWQTNFTFILQSAVRIDSGALWDTASPPPVVVSGQNLVTNGMTGERRFYRLSH